MKRFVLAASAVSLFSAGCARSVAMQPTPASPAELRARQPVEVVLPADADALAKREAVHMREPGDYVVYRFSGDYRETPITLTHQVVSYEHEYLVVDVTIDESGAQERLRLRIGTQGERAGELISVARFEGDVQTPFGVVAFGHLMNDIVLSADDTRGLLDATRMAVDVAGRELFCDVKSFDVRVGAHDAVLTTVSSSDFAWGHISGEIATPDGTLLYKAEIVDMGSGANGHVATQEDIEIYESDYDHFEE